jgi:hypothetical protein
LNKLKQLILLAIMFTLFACGGCGKKAVPKISVNKGEDMNNTGILLEFTGTAVNTVTFKGQATGTLYRFGNNPGHKRRYVYALDAPGLLALKSQFREIKPRPEAKEPAAEVKPVAENVAPEAEAEVSAVESPAEEPEEYLSVRQLEKSGPSRKTAIELIEKALKAE